jgi:hypothetical protein
MALTYLYGKVGRRFKIGEEWFFGYKSYATKEQAQNEAEKVRKTGKHARVLPPENENEKYGRYVLAISVK